MYQSVKYLSVLVVGLMLVMPATATISFNQYLHYITDVVKGDGGAFTALTWNNFDIFADDATINDSIAFIWDRGIFSGMRIRITAPVDATTFGLAWEFYNDSLRDWQELQNVNDSSLNFTVEGFHNITWNVPDDCSYYSNYGGIGAADGVPFRARIVEVTDLVDGGHSNTTGTLIRDYAIEIKDQANVRLSDIKTANDDEGWGVVEKLGNLYLIHSNLALGDQSTGNAELILKDNEVLQIGMENQRRVLLNRPISGSRPGEHWRNNTIQMGEKITGGAYGDEYINGSTLIYWNNNGLSTYNYGRFMWKVYVSKIWKATGGFTDIAMYPQTDSEFVYSMLSTPHLYWYFYSAGPTNFLANVINVELSSWFYDYASNLDIENLLIASGRGVLSGASSTIEGIDFGADKTWSVANNNRRVYWKDCTFDGNFEDMGVTGSTGSISTEQYTFNITTTDVFGNELLPPNVTLYNGQGSLLFDGAWTNAMVINATQEASGGIVTDFNPMNITISYDGYQDYNQVFTLNKKTDWLIALGSYPFVIDGTLVIRPDNTVVIKRCS